ncbi:hypothetical protein, partial [Elstera litoralis]|uniref:hypothetical protein n=1 Tax=Elstera litoralis TaxID=552518 RepID=UPI001E623795
KFKNNLIIQEKKRADLLQDVAHAIETRAEMVKKNRFRRDSHYGRTDDDKSRECAGDKRKRISAQNAKLS